MILGFLLGSLFWFLYNFKYESYMKGYELLINDYILSKLSYLID